MRREYIHSAYINDLKKTPTSLWQKRLQRLLYLPGAIIISYGLWLSITLK